MVTSREFAADEFVTELCYFLEEYRGPSVWLTLDNWETVEANAEINRVVERMLNYSRLPVRFIITSRVMPRFHVGKLREAERLRLLDQADLQFTRAELSDAVCKRLRRKLQEDELERMYAVTHGWCMSAGFAREIMQRINRDVLPHGTRGDGEAGTMTAYINEEIAASIDVNLRSFLSRASILDVISESSCVFFVPDENELRSCLDALRDSIIPCADLGNREYRLHPLVRDAFQRKLKDSLSEPELRAFYIETSRHFLETGDPERAVDLLLEVEAYEQALEVIDEQWHRLVLLDIIGKLERWLAAMPAELQAHPAHIKARVSLLGIRTDWQAVIELLDKEMKTTRIPKGHPALGIMWFSRNHCSVLTGRTNSYDETCAGWKMFNRQHGPFPDFVIAEVEATLGYSAYVELRVAEAIEHLKNCLRLTPAHDQEKLRKYRCGLSLLRHDRGHSAKAVQSLLDLMGEEGIFSTDALTPLALAYLAWFSTCVGDYEAVREYVDRIQSIATPARFFAEGALAYLEMCRGVYHFYRDESDAALTGLKRAAELSRPIIRLVFAQAALMYEYYGELSGKTGSLLESTEYPDLKRDSIEMLYYRTLQAYRAGKVKEYDQAIDHITRVREAAERAGVPSWVVTGCLFESFFRDKIGDTQRSQQLLRRGLAVRDEIKWRNYPLANSEVTAFAITRAVTWSIDTRLKQKLAYTGRLADIRDCIVDDLSHDRVPPRRKAALIEFAGEQRIPGLTGIVHDLGACDDLTISESCRTYLAVQESMELPPLKIRTFGEFAVSGDCGRVHFPRAKSKQLLASLLLDYPGRLHEEKIMEHFWPDADPGRSRQSLQTSVSGLRKSLDPDSLLSPRSYIRYDSSNYSLDIPDNSEIDFHQLQHVYDQYVRRLDKDTGLPINRERRIREALDRYHGGMLPELQYEAFVVERREQLERQYYELLERYIDMQLLSDAQANAEKYLTRGLQLNPLWEGGVKLALELYPRFGKTIQALKAYRNYEALLKSQFDLEPGEHLRHRFYQLGASA
jgi:DNA-binding SARP family transcriptional activator